LGPDVNLVHRLLKNTVTDQLGLRAYCLYTGPARERLGLQEVTTLVAHDEDVPDFGLAATYIQDLGGVYRPGEEAGITLDDSEVLFVQEADLPMSPAVVGNYLSSSVFCSILIGSQKQEIKDLVGGRIGVGSAYQCYHGNRVTPQRIIEWEPFTKIITEDLLPKPLKGGGLVVTYLEETSSGTHLRRELGGFKGPRWSETLFRVGMVLMKRMATRSLADFVDAITTDHLRRFEAASAPPVMP